MGQKLAKMISSFLLLVVPLIGATDSNPCYSSFSSFVYLCVRIKGKHIIVIHLTAI